MHNITAAAQPQQPSLRPDAQRIIELADGRLADPHAALVAELIGISFEHAALNEPPRRLAILQGLHRHLICEDWRGRIGSWLYDPSRVESLRQAIKDEIERIATVPHTEVERIFAEGYIPGILAAVR